MLYLFCLVITLLAFDIYFQTIRVRRRHELAANH